MQKTFYTEYYQVEDKHWWFVGRRQIILKLLDQRFSLSSKDHNILDVGCGTGTMLTHLARYGRVVGIALELKECCSIFFYCGRLSKQFLERYGLLISFTVVV